MRGPKTIDLLRYPRELQTGDIIGFDQFPGQTARKTATNSGMDAEAFAVSPAPRYRGMVVGTEFDPKNNDRVTGVLVYPLVPISKTTHWPNTDTTLVITHQRQKTAGGLDADLNWQLNYVPVSLFVRRGAMGTAEDSQIVRYGVLPETLTETISNHTLHLAERGMIGFTQSSRGQVRDYSRMNEQVGRRVTDAERRLAEEAVATGREAILREREERKLALREEARLFAAPPSGKIAANLSLGFNLKANPDITLENAQSAGLISEEQYLELSIIGEEMKTGTLRGVYDHFVNQHEKTLEIITATGAHGNKSALIYKAETEIALKDALVDFYKLQRSTRPAEAERRHTIEQAVIPYQPKPEGP